MVVLVVVFKEDEKHIACIVLNLGIAISQNIHHRLGHVYGHIESSLGRIDEIAFVAASAGIEGTSGTRKNQKCSHAMHIQL